MAESSGLSNPQPWLQAWAEANRQRILPPEPVPRRYGQFRIHGCFFRDCASLQAIQLILAEVIIVRCEHLVATDEFIYHAWCAHWPEIKPGEVLPTYDAVVHAAEGRIEWRNMP